MSQLASLRQMPPGTSVTSTHLEGPSPSATPSVSQSQTPDTSAPTPPLQDLQRSENRMRAMAQKAVQRAGGLPCLNGQELATIKANTARPGLFSRGRSSYKNMEKAAAACDAAGKALSAVPMSGFAQNPISEVAYKALQKFVEAQNALSTAIDAYCSATGKHPPALETLSRSAQFRAAEALNFAAVMQMGQGPAPESVREGITQMAPEMHGGSHLLNAVREQATEIFERIDTLQSQQSQQDPMAMEDFRQEINTLRNKVEELKSQLAANRSEAGFQADEGVFDALEGMLARSSARLDSLANASPMDGVASALNNILPRVDGDVCKEVGKLISHGEDLERDTAVYNQKVSDLLNDVRAGRLDRASLDRRLGELQSFLPRSQGVREAFALAQTLKAQKKSVPPALTAFLAVANHIPYHTELNEIHEMMEKTGGNRHARAEYIAMAYEHNLDLQTVMEASLRGIPTDQLELEAGDGVLKESRTLGQGAVNSVDLCTYRGSDGENKTLVFKPELGARQGLDHLCAGALGYDARVRVMQINVAASRSAEAIGCGDVVAKSSIGSHDGKIGLFMEAAPGKTARALSSENPICKTASGKELNMEGALRYMQKNGMLDTARANLMRECNKLEWADLLSGQVDRHSDNYLVHINPDTGDVKITGIDNDASFGSRRVGLNHVDVRGMEDRLVGKIRPELIINGHINLSALTPEELANLRYVFGFNQASLPPCIDRNTYDELMAINVDTYRTSMRSCMDDTAAEAAVSRLEAAIAHARSLASQGKVVKDWRTPEAQEIIKHSYIPCPLNQRFPDIRNGFYNRDMAHKFGYLS